MGPPLGSTSDLLKFDLAIEVLTAEFSLEVFGLNGSFFSIKDMLFSF